jgi:hypothetical protein
MKDKRWGDKAKREIEHYGNRVKQKYGCLANLSKMLSGNIEGYYGNIDVQTYLIGL